MSKLALVALPLLLMSCRQQQGAAQERIRVHYVFGPEAPIMPTIEKRAAKTATVRRRGARHRRATQQSTVDEASPATKSDAGAARLDYAILATPVLGN